ncbi:MscS mechanosensitive ion channel [Lelliottia amnigena]|nr:MscS mechanosensitive ion channel [Lelliottia amnigena]
MENIKNALDANEIQMPYPQMDVHLNDQRQRTPSLEMMQQ